jgi:transcriptional regulator with XRE-family HTH domain
MDMLKIIGENIRFLRESNGDSQETIATHTGLQRSYIGAVERGERNLSNHDFPNRKGLPSARMHEIV